MVTPKPTHVEIALCLFFLLVPVAVLINHFRLGVHADTADKAARDVTLLGCLFGCRKLHFRQHRHRQVKVFKDAPHRVVIALKSRACRHHLPVNLRKGHARIVKTEPLILQTQARLQTKVAPFV